MRPCYREIFDECQRHFLSGIEGVFLVGTPGIGKSVFLDFALHRFLQAGKTVLYLDGPDENLYVFRTDGTVDKDSLSVLQNDVADNVDDVLYDPHEELSSKPEAKSMAGIFFHTSQTFLWWTHCLSLQMFRITRWYYK